MVAPPAPASVPTLVAFDGVLDLSKQAPSSALTTLMQNMANHLAEVATASTEAGEPMLTFQPPARGSNDTFIGDLGYDVPVFHDGRAMQTLSAWYLRSGDVRALDATKKLSAFVRNTQNHVLWKMPANMPGGAGHFAGHQHSYLHGLLGLIGEAEARRKANPGDPFASALIDYVRSGYVFARDYNGLGTLGNFGEICAVGDMVRLAAKLTDIGAGDYFEDIDRIVRNELTEKQILDTSKMKANVTGTNSYVDVPGVLTGGNQERVNQYDVKTRVRGLFFEDATHPLAIPFDPAAASGLDVMDKDSVNANFMSVACSFGNPMRGLYEAWERIVTVKGAQANVNLLLNRRSEYLDVKSELPYRGVVHIVTKSSIGPLTSLRVRIPDWADKSKVKVFVNGHTLSGWAWDGKYAVISGLAKDAMYTVAFPMVSRAMTITQVRSQSAHWTESNTPGATHPFQISTTNGTFKGNTLVSVDRRPTGGVPLYQRDALSKAALDAHAPTRTRQSFSLSSTSTPWSPAFYNGASFDPASPLGPRARIDFSGDKRSDILWRNTATGDVSVMFMNGTTWTSLAPTGRVGLDLVAEATADFDADGKADILWRSKSTGAFFVMPMNGAVPKVNDSTPAGQMGFEWQIAGVGDFDADQKADVLWRSTATGRIMVMLMDGNKWRTIKDVGAVGLSLEVAGIGDFDGDGKSDIAWRNKSTGQFYVMRMNGASLKYGDNVLAGQMGLEWKVVGIADFDADGKADMAWRNTAGAISVVYMNGVGAARVASLGTIAPDRAVATIDDFDGDGQADLLLRSASTGSFYVTLIRGGVAGPQVLSGQMGAEWQVASR